MAVFVMTPALSPPFECVILFWAGSISSTARIMPMPIVSIYATMMFVSPVAFTPIMASAPTALASTAPVTSVATSTVAPVVMVTTALVAAVM